MATIPGTEADPTTEVFNIMEALGLAEDMAEGLQQEGDAPVVVKVLVSGFCLCQAHRYAIHDGSALICRSLP